MVKNKYNKGITLIEILVSIFILTLITIFSYYIIGRIYEINSKNQELLNETIIIKNTYDLFTVDPNNFKENIEVILNGYWENDIFYYFDLSNLYIKYVNDNYSISIYLYKEKELIEIWERKMEI